MKRTTFITVADRLAVIIGMRHLRIIRNDSGELVAGACARCNWHFSLPEGEVWGNAKDFLRRKFDEHKCVQKNVRQVAVRGRSNTGLGRSNITS